MWSTVLNTLGLYSQYYNIKLLQSYIDINVILDLSYNLPTTTVSKKYAAPIPYNATADSKYVQPTQQGASGATES